MKNFSIASLAKLAFTFSEFDANHDTVEIFVKVSDKTFCFDVQTNRSNPGDIDIDYAQADVLALAEALNVDVIPLAAALVTDQRLQELVVTETAQGYAEYSEAEAIHAQCATSYYTTYDERAHCVHDDIQYCFIADNCTLFVRTTIGELRSKSLPDSVTIADEDVLDRIEAAIEDSAEDPLALFAELYAKAHAVAA